MGNRLDDGSAAGSGRVFPLTSLGRRLADVGAREVLVKRLAPNDNSKNQIYLAGDVSALGKIPSGEVETVPGTSAKQGRGKRGPIFRAKMDLQWLTPSGELVRAPHAKLIMYPQYSEVRLSGFLRSCSAAPSGLFDIGRHGRDPGRVLVLAPLEDGRIVAVAFPPESEEARALRSHDGEPYGVFHRFELRGTQGPSSQSLLISRLRHIHLAGWLDPVYLEADGSFSPCAGTNCGGVTLESHLGIRANGKSEPDFHGWEVKQHGVFSIAKPRASRITLMTPEPSGGFYVDQGAEQFVRKWGYPDQTGRQDRFNFGGVYRSGAQPHGLTGLRLVLRGYDADSGVIDTSGGVQLLSTTDEVAAEWSFSKLMDHWRKKHAQAAYVPSQIQRKPDIRYRYGKDVLLAEGAKFKLLLRAFADGVVYYDPGMKIEQAGSGRPQLKRRSQFRVDSRRISGLYEKTRLVDVTETA